MWTPVSDLHVGDVITIDYPQASNGSYKITVEWTNLDKKTGEMPFGGPTDCGVNATFVGFVDEKGMWVVYSMTGCKKLPFKVEPAPKAPTLANECADLLAEINGILGR